MLVVVPLFLALFVAMVAWGIYASRQRQDGMERLSVSLGWTFADDHAQHSQNKGWFARFSDGVSGDYEEQETYKPFDVFTRGHGRRPYNTLRGRLNLSLGERPPRECPCLAGDFEYTTGGGGKSSHTHRFSYLLVALPDIHRPLPCTLVRPEGLSDRLESALGFDDIDFESVEFSDAFYVTSDDKRFAYGLLDPRMMQFFLDTRPGMLELKRRHLCLGNGEKKWTPAEFEARLRWCGQFLEHWPRQLR